MRLKVTVPVDLTRHPKLTFNGLFYFIADSLRVEQIQTTVYDEHQINFSTGLFRLFWDWAPLSTIFGGKIRFQTDAQRILVISHLSFIDTVIIASVLVGMLAYANYRIFLLGKGDQIFYVVAWLGILGGNLFFSISRWRQFIRQCVKDAADRVYLSKEDILAQRREQWPTTP